MTEVIPYLKKLSPWAKLLIAAMLITTLSFFVQSALPTETSAEESDAVSDAIEPIIPSESPVGQVVHPNIRKIGHFVEFGALGLEAALFIFFFMKKRLKGAFGFSAVALFIALCDETVQIFSGRGPDVADVWLDFSGFLTFFVLTTAVAFLLHKLKRKIH